MSKIDISDVLPMNGRYIVEQCDEVEVKEKDSFIIGVEKQAEQMLVYRVICTPITLDGENIPGDKSLFFIASPHSIQMVEIQGEEYMILNANNCLGSMVA